jgi:hypothetical protein
MNTFVEDMMALSKEQQDKMKREMNSIPLGDEESSAIMCDIMGCRLLSPCRLNACPYNIDDEDNLNCIKNLKAGDKKKKPTQAAIAQALDVPLDTMRELLASAMGKMRKRTLQEKIDDGNSNRFRYITNAKVCVACASRVENDNHKHEVAVGQYIYYCSRSCESRRPVAQIKIEIEYGSDTGEVLATARKLFKKLDTIQATLNVRKTSLIQWYEALLGVKPHEFGLDAASAVDVLRKSSATSPENSFVSILSVDKSSRWWVEYDAKLQSALMGI